MIFRAGMGTGGRFPRQPPTSCKAPDSNVDGVFRRDRRGALARLPGRASRETNHRTRPRGSVTGVWGGLVGAPTNPPVAGAAPETCRVFDRSGASVTRSYFTLTDKTSKLPTEWMAIPTCSNSSLAAGRFGNRCDSVVHARRHRPWSVRAQRRGPARRSYDQLRGRVTQLPVW
jgi:hypothetical protein